MNHDQASKLPSLDPEYDQYMTEITQILCEDNIGIVPSILKESIQHDDHSVQRVDRVYREREKQLMAQLQRVDQQHKQAIQEHKQEKERFQSFQAEWLKEQQVQQDQLRVLNEQLQDMQIALHSERQEQQKHADAQSDKIQERESILETAKHQFTEHTKQWEQQRAIIEKRSNEKLSQKIQEAAEAKNRHDEIQLEHTKLRDDHDGLQFEHTKLRDDHDGLQFEHTKLREGHDELREAHDKLIKSRDHLKETVQRVDQQKYKLENKLQDMRQKQKKIKNDTETIAESIISFLSSRGIEIEEFNGSLPTAQEFERCLKLLETYVTRVGKDSREFVEQHYLTMLDVFDEHPAKSITSAAEQKDQTKFDYDDMKKRLKKYQDQLSEYYHLKAQDQSPIINEMNATDFAPEDFFKNLQAAKSEEESASGSSAGGGGGDYDPDGGVKHICSKWYDYYIDGKSLDELVAIHGTGSALNQIVEDHNPEATIDINTQSICYPKPI